VYTGDKKTTLVTLDAQDGKVLKWFDSSSTVVNEAQSCLKPNALIDLDSEECSNSGTITLGRTQYTVGIFRQDGRPIASLKYTEWGPNTYDNDLKQQYRKSMDHRYFTSKHDGQVYGFDFTQYERAHRVAPLFTQTLSSPVGKVFDVVRPWAVPQDSIPELVILPQPPPPEIDPQAKSRRVSSIYLNQTEGGSWYAMSGDSYPLIIEAPRALVSSQEWWDNANGPSWDTLNAEKISRALIGTHYLDMPIAGNQKERLTLPGGSLDPQSPEDGTDNSSDNEYTSNSTTVTEPPEPTAIIDQAKRVPQLAANSFAELFKNPFFVAIACVAAIWYVRELRHRKIGGGKKLVDATPATESLVIGSSSESLVLTTAREVVPNPAEVIARGATSVSHDTTVDTGDAIVEKPLPPLPETDGVPESLEKIEEEVAVPDGALPGLKKELSGLSSTSEEKKKKAHRGRRGGVKHKKGKDGGSQRDDSSQRARSGSLEPTTSNDPNVMSTAKTVDEVVDQAKQLGVNHQPRLEPDVITVNGNPEEVSGPILKMGSLEVNEDAQLGTGSNGTVVFAGKWDGREVAVKRMLIQFYDIASQETRLLRESDDHPNGKCFCQVTGKCGSYRVTRRCTDEETVIRYFAQQQRAAFLYIALELCQASLADVVERPGLHRELAQAGERNLPDVLFQITKGLSHLHKLRIVHRDLKPQNILVKMRDDGTARLLVSDFGLCKKLEGGQSSFGATTAHAAGTSGWRAPELLLDDDARESGAQSMIDASTLSGSGTIGDGTDAPQGPARRATRSIDIFSLGLVFFYVLTKGSHPFDCGDRYMREVNIRKDNKSLAQLDVLGDYAAEARDLINSMLSFDPNRRPTAVAVMQHPFFWPAKRRLDFLCDVSDAFEKEPRDPPSAALSELERWAPTVIESGDFLKSLPKEFIESMAKQRKYTGGRMLDLLRALRNKKNHYEEIPETLRKTMPMPEGYLGFWTRRFPRLLLACWEVVYELRWDESDRFREYFTTPPSLGTAA
jgi:serine/threonine-protein kinase/endoribonuclease IRE1